MPTQQIISRSFRILSILLFVLGGYLTYEYRMFLNETTPVKATVTHITPQERLSGKIPKLLGKSADLYLSFTTPDHKRITVKESLSALSSLPKEGDELLYYYHQTQPEKSRLSRFWPTWQGTFIAGVGLLLFMSTTLPLLYQKRRGREKE